MKRSFFSSRQNRKSGFTLIELLVVIGIIAILAAVLFPVGTMVINAAKRAKASATIGAIQTAVMAYNTEYSVWPVPTATTTDTLIGDSSATDATNWQTLICVLCGNIHPSDGTAFTAVAAGPTNTRSIAFLNLKSSDVFTTATGKDAPKNPLPTSATANIYFNIAMDSDYDGLLGTTAPTNASSTGMPNFATSTTGTITYPGTSTAGVVLWGNCNGSASSQNPNFYVKTY